MVRGRLTLDILIGVVGERATIRDLLFFGWTENPHLEFEVIDNAPTPPKPTVVVTLISVTVISRRSNRVPDSNTRSLF